MQTLRHMMGTLFHHLGPLSTEGVVAPVTTIQDVLDDFVGIDAKGKTVRDEVREFPETGGTLMMALGIHNDTAKLQSLVDKTTKDVKAVPLPVSVEDGTKVLEAINDIKLLLAEAMKLAAEKKSAFENMSIGGITSIVKFDLTMLHDSVAALEDALITASPPELLEIANTIKSEIEGIFAKVIAAYS